MFEKLDPERIMGTKGFSGAKQLPMEGEDFDEKSFGNPYLSIFPHLG